MTTGNLAWALHSIARKIKPPSVAPKPVTTPEIEEAE
jgi:hypothetical protein